MLSIGQRSCGNVSQTYLQGMTPAELQDGGARANDWPQVESAMFGKIERDMVLTLP